MTKKKAIISGFIFGLVMPFLFFGLALQSSSILGQLAQGFIEFSFVAMRFFDQPFGNLSGIQQLIVFLSSGLVWMFLFWGMFNISILFRTFLTLRKLKK